MGTVGMYLKPIRLNKLLFYVCLLGQSIISIIPVYIFFMNINPHSYDWKIFDVFQIFNPNIFNFILFIITPP